MGFFSNELASTLQYFTFPFEVVGLTLAAIEMRFPVVASRINTYLLAEEGYQALLSQKSIFDLLLHPEVPPVGPLSKLSRLQMRSLVISIAGTIVFVFLLEAHNLFQQGYYLPSFITVVVLVLMVPFTYAGIWVSNGLYKFINNWVPGRTVGTLGIIIAAFGVLGEAYQFTTQLVV
jgi:hypothetical protein